METEIGLKLLPVEIFCNIIIFLDKISLRKLDSAISDKKLRHIFLNILQSSYYQIIMNGRIDLLSVCKWSNIRNIKNYTEIVHFTNIKYVSSICKKLTVFTQGKYSKYNLFDINNDVIEYLYVDFGSQNFIKFNSLKAKNLKKLIIVRGNNIQNVLDTIKNNCPKLETIKLIYCNKL